MSDDINTDSSAPEAPLSEAPAAESAPVESAPTAEAPVEAPLSEGSENASEEVDNNYAPESVESALGTFKASLPEEYREHPAFQDIKDLEGLSKSYLHSQQMLGRSIRIPDSEASEEIKQEFYNKLSSIPGVVKLPNSENKEELDAFYNRMGRPESADKYELKFDDLPVDQSTLGQFKELAHSMGLTQDQAKKLAEFEVNRVKSALETSQQKTGQSLKVLHEKWGADYNNRIAGAKAAMQEYKKLYPEAAEALLASDVAVNPIFLTMLADSASHMREAGTLPKGSAPDYGMTPEEAMAKIEAINSNKEHAFWNPRHPEHNKAVENRVKYYKIAYPEG